jgi:hypothetical protein
MICKYFCFGMTSQNREAITGFLISRTIPDSASYPHLVLAAYIYSLLDADAGNSALRPHVSRGNAQSSPGNRKTGDYMGGKFCYMDCSCILAAIYWPLEDNPLRSMYMYRVCM